MWTRFSWTGAMLLAALSLQMPVAEAATVVPNTTADDYDAAPDATCSLREAVKTIDVSSDFGGCTHSGAFPSNNTIQLVPGTYELSIDGDAAGNESGDLNFFATLRIEALPGGPAVIDANGLERVLFYSGDLTLDGISITGGVVGTPDPMTGFIGGGIATSGGTSLTMLNGAVFGNQADGPGGGIEANGPLSLSNVTISGNTTTDSGGGGIDAEGSSLFLDHVTVTANQSLVNSPAQSSVAGGIYSNAATTSIHNSIVAGNSDASVTFDAPDCQGTLTSTGGNVIGDTAGCTLTSMSSDSLGMPAMLGPLGSNGGTSQTHSLLTGSPAIDRGVAACAPTDQRGFARPFPAGGACDSGAYERWVCDGTVVNQNPPLSACPSPSPPGTSPGNPVAPRKKKCKKKKTGSAAAKRKCKRKKKR
jgi:CSLREA domain-containing protein